MKSARTHRHLLAWVLFSFVLINGVLCGVGHGQMLAAAQSSPMPVATQLSSADICGPGGEQVAAIEAPHRSGHGLWMQLAMFDCAFAGKLTGALLLVGGLVWLLRALDVGPRLFQGVMPTAPRNALPGLVPQAP